MEDSEGRLWLFPSFFEQSGGSFEASVPAYLLCDHSRHVRTSYLVLQEVVVPSRGCDPRPRVDCGEARPNE